MHLIKLCCALLLLFSCNNNKQVSETQTRVLNNQRVQSKENDEPFHFLHPKPLTVFDFNTKQLQEDLTNIYTGHEKNAVPSHSDLWQQVTKERNYEGLFFYCPISQEGAFQVFTLLGYHDYYSDILLVTYANEKVINWRIIASAEGDGSDFYYKKSTVEGKDLLSRFINGQRTLTTPKDTIFYNLQGRSRIKTDAAGLIKEDTIQAKRKVILVKDESFVIEADY